MSIAPILHVSVIVKPPFVYECAVSLGVIQPSSFETRIFKTHNCRYPGVDIAYLQAISFILNVTFVLHYYAETGRVTNGTWNGMVGSLIDGKADLSSRLLWYTPERANVIEYGDPHLFHYALITRKLQSLTMYKFGLLTPFSTHVWIAISCSGFAIFLLLLGYNFMSGVRSNQLFNIGFLTTSQNRYIVAENVLYLAISPARLALVTKYTAVLLAILIPRVVLNPSFRNVAELKGKVMKNKIKLAHIGQTGMDMQFKGLLSTKNGFQVVPYVQDIP